MTSISQERTMVNIDDEDTLRTELSKGSGEDWKLQIFDKTTTYSPDSERESKRLMVLKGYNILETDKEIEFEETTRAAKEMFNVPIAVVSLVDFDRQWFKSIQGLDVAETPRCVAFCSHVVNSKNHRKCFVVNDATEDVRFKDNPLVTGGPKIRFYAGAPIYSPEEEILGSFCIIDYEPRAFSAREEEQLLLLASETVLNIITR
jgi:GAF domain-containing protein